MLASLPRGLRCYSPRLGASHRIVRRRLSRHRPVRVPSAPDWRGAICSSHRHAQWSAWWVRSWPREGIQPEPPRQLCGSLSRSQPRLGPRPLRHRPRSLSRWQRDPGPRPLRHRPRSLALGQPQPGPRPLRHRPRSLALGQPQPGPRPLRLRPRPLSRSQPQPGPRPLWRLIGTNGRDRRPSAGTILGPTPSVVG